MADVKDGSVLAGPDVRSSDSEVSVLDGHGPASKGDHLATVLDVVVVEDSLLQDLWGDCIIVNGKKSVFMVSYLLPNRFDLDLPPTRIFPRFLFSTSDPWGKFGPVNTRPVSDLRIPFSFWQDLWQSDQCPEIVNKSRQTVWGYFSRATSILLWFLTSPVAAAA